MAERASASFSHSAESSAFEWPRCHFKIADIMKKTQEDKTAVILIVDGFESLNIQKYLQFFSIKSVFYSDV